MRLFQSQIANRKSKISAYSFTEVMFAVVVLGIGFIMIAAMFPVAISLSKATSDETSAAAIARGGVNYIRAIATERNMPPTDGGAPGAPAPVAPFIGTPGATTMAPPYTGSWQAIRGSVVLGADPRFGFVPLYRRETDSATAQVFIIAVQARARSRYDNTDTQNPATVWHGNLQARPVEIVVNRNGGGTGIPWVVIADSTAASAPAAAAAAVEGTYIVIAADPGDSTVTPRPVGAFNGRVYRLGAQAIDGSGNIVPNTWTFQPGNEYETHPGPDGIPNNGNDYEIGDDAVALLVGREYDTETVTPIDDYRGPAQDIAVYTSFIQVRP